MPLRQSLRHLGRKLLNHRGDASTSGGSMGQGGTGGQTDASTLSTVSTTREHGMPASTTSIDVPQTRLSNATAVSKVQSELESHLQPSPGHATLDKSASLPEHLWDRAYDDLKVQETALVQAYERILSGKLCDRGLESNDDVYEENTIAQDNPSARRTQMERLITSGIAKITREARFKENIGTGIQVIMSAKDIISSAIQSNPQAALAWAGVCVALEASILYHAKQESVSSNLPGILQILGNSVNAAEAKRNGIQYVVDRMEWYWTLPDVILKKNTGAYSHLSRMESKIETQLLGLYKTLLLYQIKSVCSYYKNRGLVFLRDVAKLDDWNGDIKAIQNAEASFYNDANVHREEKMNANLEQLVTYMEKQMTKEDRQCFKDLGVTDPRYDKKRIEKTKGGLLEDSYCWILNNSDFLQWRDDKERRLLWIKGDPGKGKTMLLCGIANELRKPSTYSGLVSYFFCQATDQRINNAIAALWGLMFMLVDQQPSLMSHIREKYDTSGKELFTGVNAWIALSDIFSDMLHDPTLTTAYLLIDALDECISDRERLLDLIVENLSVSSSVKWIVSSRNWPEIERRLAGLDGTEKTSLSLEVNADLVSRAVDAYIEHEISRLILIKHHPTLKGQVHEQMRQKANGTFLWVALVVKDLRDRQDAEYEDPSSILNLLLEMPSDLPALYSRMLDQIGRLEGDTPKLCQNILSIVALAFRPLTLAELGTIAGFGSHLTNEPALERLVNKCGSFLTIRDSTVYFVHQSAKDHLITNDITQSIIFPSGQKDIHHTIFSRSLHAMAKILKKNIFTLLYPGSLIDEIETPDPDPLAAVRYSCIHWITHLCEGISHNSINVYQDDLSDTGVVSLFLHKHFLHWLEALSLLHNISNGIIFITRLENLLKIQSLESQFFNFLQDVRRFVLHNKHVIEIAPLQTYSSALIFSPTQSLIRKLFHKEVPSWIQNRPIIRDYWSPCLQTLEGHSDRVTSVAYSTDNKQVASGSWDNTIKIWDTAIGSCVQTLEGHSHYVLSITFLGDGKLVSGSADNTIKIWDIATGACIQTFNDHGDDVNSVTLLEDGKLASGSTDNTIKIWDIATGACIQTLKGHGHGVNSVIFLRDGKLASGSRDETIKIWDIATGACIQTLKGHNNWVSSVILLGDGKLASGSRDETIKIWDIATGACIQTLNNHGEWVISLAFLKDGKLASGSTDDTIKIWDIATGACIQTLKGHGYWVYSVIFLGDSKLASGSRDKTVKIWDIATGMYAETFESHESYIYSITFSRDKRQAASGSADGTIKIWDSATGSCIKTFESHRRYVTSVAYSRDSKQVASGSDDHTVKIWDIATGVCIKTFEGHSQGVTSVAYSRDSKQVTSGSADGTIKIWDIATGACIQTLKGHDNWVNSVAFSGDSKQVASGSFDKTVKIWDIATRVCVSTLRDHRDSICSLAFSGSNKQVASGSDNGEIKIWDIATGVCVQTLHIGVATQLFFGQRMKSRLYTNRGAVDLDIESALNTPLAKTSLQLAGRYGYGIDDTDTWIVKDGMPMLWLPVEYRPDVSAVVGSMVAIGCASGRVLVMRFLE